MPRLPSMDTQVPSLMPTRSIVPAASEALASPMWMVESASGVFSAREVDSYSSLDLIVPATDSSPTDFEPTIDVYDDMSAAFVCASKPAKRDLPPYFTSDFMRLHSAGTMPSPHPDDLLNTFAGHVDLGDVLTMNIVHDDTFVAEPVAAATPAATVTATKTSPSTRKAAPSRSVSPSPGAADADANDDVRGKYLRRRRNNNESACRSRAKRRQLEKDNADKVDALERANGELTAKLEKLENEAKYLRSLLLTLAKNSAMPSIVMDGFKLEAPAGSPAPAV